MKKLYVFVLRAMVLECPPGERWTIDDLTEYVRIMLKGEDMDVSRRRVEIAIECLKGKHLVEFTGDWELQGDKITEEARRGLWDIKNAKIWKEIYDFALENWEQKRDPLSEIAALFAGGKHGKE